MKRFKLIYFLAIIFALSFTGQCFADNNYLNMFGGIGAGYYYLYPKDIQIRNYYRGAVTYKGFLGFKAENGLSAVGDISYYNEGNMSSLAPYGTTLTIIPVTASLAYHLFNGSSFSPYFGGGIGIYFINESDPDVNYLSATKFGKHIFVGADLYISSTTILRGELRQTFIDPVNSSLYYQASFGGLTATASIAMEWPFGGRTPMTTQEAAAQYAYDEHIAMMNRINDMNSYYDQQNWNRNMYYRPWNTPDVYINTIAPPPPTQQQIDAQNAQAEQVKAEQSQKRQEYIDQKQQLRQEKKDSLTKPK